MKSSPVSQADRRRPPGQGTHPLRWAGWAGLLALALFPVVVRDEYFRNIGTVTLLLAYLAAAWNLVGGLTGQLSFAHPVYMAFGAYSAAILNLTYGISPWVGMAVGVVLASLVALAIGYVSFRLRGPYYALVTIAMLEVFRLLFLNLTSLTGGPKGLLVSGYGSNPWQFQFTSYAAHYYITLVLLLALLGITYRITRSRLGSYLLAVRENEDAALALGIDPMRQKLIAVTISGAMTAMGGTVYAQFTGFIEPDVLLGLNIAVQMIAMSVIGGLGTIAGPIVGAFLLMPISEFFRGALGHRPGIHLMLYGLVLVVVILLAPQGIVGELEARLGRAGRQKQRTGDQGEKGNLTA